MTLRLTLSFLALVLLALPLAACGKKGSPHAPGPQDKITFPQTYPPAD
ncbi:hypothetical protein OQ252_01180 [Acetobacter farinalis]|uniref:Lipoprotein n=1 Tax=Acetobacter farinalis TaxID=1260984 RepID=A0ABT3Q417_9PROT|nr:hypothetical protein [Acetobacter farinalis]MCX2560015.1 hypothetical protein [Acetobacter farinalis]